MPSRAFSVRSTIAPTTCASSLASRATGALRATWRRGWRRRLRGVGGRRAGFRRRAWPLPSPSTRISPISPRFSTRTHSSRAGATANSPPSSPWRCTRCASLTGTHGAAPAAPPLRYRSCARCSVRLPTRAAPRMPRNGGAGAGLPLETICTFACGRYPVLVESELFDGADPGALDWLLRTNLHFMQAVRHHRAGDVTKAMTALGEDNDAEELWAGTRYRD